MKVIGIGVDIINNNRISRSIKINYFWKEYILIKKFYFPKNKKQTLFFAKRSAAKEAFAKSLGTGFRKNLNFNDISVKNDKLGKPSFLISKKIKKLIKKKFKTNSFNFFLSISDERNYSVAFVVFQK